MNDPQKMAPHKKRGRKAKDDLKIKVRQLTKAPGSGNDDRAPPDYRLGDNPSVIISCSATF